MICENRKLLFIFIEFSFGINIACNHERIVYCLHE